jgi:pyruvate/2-oxoglutarate/acetoin dehydrogenase E1 component
MTYKDELIAAMNMLSKEDRVIFLGQEADTFYRTMSDIPKDKIIVMPVMEDAQMGISIGLSLAGYLPISLYTRMDFFLLAFNQLINHLDKIEEMSSGEFQPKIVIRVAVGETKPLDPGPQHTQDFSNILKQTLKNINVMVLENKEDVIPSYKNALQSKKSSILVEKRDLYGI